MSMKTIQKECPGMNAGAVLCGDRPWRKSYLPFFAVDFAAGLAADLVVFFETGFLAVAMWDLLSRVNLELL